MREVGQQPPTARGRGALLLLCGLTACNAFDSGLLGPARMGEPDGGPAMPAMDAGRRDAGGGSDAGAVGDVCRCQLTNASATCDVDAACAVDECDPGFLDCDADPDNGCEVDAQRDPSHCGACDSDCNAALANAAETACGAGQTCMLVTCAEGFASCDGDDATGCETSIFSVDNCGGCAASSDNQRCENLPNATSASCPVGTCEIDACDAGWANCDGDASNGCEQDETTAGPCAPKLMRITVDPSFVDEALADFPVLVRITDEDLKGARSDGADLVFSTDGGVGPTRLPFEIESWNATAGALVAWVRLSSVSPTASTTFYLRYADGLDLSQDNRPQNVWDGNFESVHHLGESLADSTANGIDGTNQGTTVDAAGQIAGARAFAAAAFANMGTGVLPAETRFTLSAWVKVDLGVGGAQKYVMDTSEVTAPYNGMGLGLQQADGAVGAYVGGAWRFSASDFVSAGAWTLIAVRYNVAAVDGVLESSVNGEPFETVFTGDTSDAQNVAGSPFQLGRWAGNSFHFDGSVDELRVSSSARSDAWIRAEYENQKSGSSFLSVVIEPP